MSTFTQRGNEHLLDGGVLWIGSGEDGLHYGSLALPVGVAADDDDTANVAGDGETNAATDAGVCGDGIAADEAMDWKQVLPWQKLGFFARHPLLDICYAADQVAALILAFAPTDGDWLRPRLLGVWPSGDRVPCHLAVSPDGGFLAVAHYNGALALYPLLADGRLAATVERISFSGSGPEKQRQTCSHPHGVYWTVCGRWLYVADLGTDRVEVLERAGRNAASSADNTAERNPASRAKGIAAARADSSVKDDAQAEAWLVREPLQLAGGCGPRHLALHSNGLHAVVAGELANTVTLCRIGSDGALHALQTISTLPQGWEGVSYVAEIVFHPAGGVFFVTNRGHDSVAVFTFEQNAETMANAGWVGCAGSYPQHLEFFANAHWLLIANSRSNTVSRVQLDPHNGLPCALRASVFRHVARPMCLLRF